MTLISETLEGTVTRATFVSSPSKELRSFGTTTFLMGKVRAYSVARPWASLRELISPFCYPGGTVSVCHNQ